MTFAGSIAFAAGAIPGPPQSSSGEREFQSAVADYDAQRYAEAAKKLEPLAARLPNNFEVNELLGLVSAAQNREDKANRYLARAVRLKPDSAEARTNLAVNLAHQGKNAAAETEFKKAAELEPSSYDSNHNLGEFYVKTGKLAAAIPYLERAQTAGASYENGYDLALAYADTGQPAAARTEVEDLIKQRDTAELHNLLAEVDEKAGDYIAAEREYERAAHMDPSESNIFDWGSELLLHQTAEPAIQVFTAGIERYPRSARLEIGLGIALYSRGSYDDAVKAFSRSTDLDPSDPRPYLFLAKAYNVSNSQAGEVIERLHRLVELEPKSAEAHYYYAISLWKGRREEDRSANLDSIRALLEKAIELDPRFAAAYLELGVLDAGQHRYPDAMLQYQQAMKLDPSLIEAHYRLAQALVRTGDRGRADQEFALYERLHQEQVASDEKRRVETQQFILNMKQ